MRTSSILISGAVAAVAVAGSANAAVVWQTFDSLATAANTGAVSNTAGNSTFLTASSSVSITTDSWSSTRILYAAERQSQMQITGGTAIFTTGKGPNVVYGPPINFTVPGNDGRAEIRYQSIGTRNLTDFQFRLNVTGVTNGGGSLIVRLSDAGGANQFTRTNSVSASGFQTFDFTGQAGLTAITYIAFEFVRVNATLGSTQSVTVNSIQYVPAPGAMALLGVAGLAGRRRRS